MGQENYVSKLVANTACANKRLKHNCSQKSGMVIMGSSGGQVVNIF